MALALAALWVWNVYDKALISHYARKYRTTPLPEKPSHNSSDVSIIAPTIDTEPTFTECMRLWLESNPLEVIIVTVKRDEARVRKLLEPLEEYADKIIVLLAPFANKRQQLMVGVDAAKGKILALVDDDVYWREKGVVPHLLAPFENDKVGAVAGIQSAEIPIERQDPRVITPWEATATYDLFLWKGSREVHFAADGGCWCLSARTLFIRASILQDPDFAQAYTHEVIGRRIVNTADDVVLTEWVFDRGWEVSIQNTPEAEVTTNIPRDHKFVWQILRWDRGNFRSFLGFLFVNPGLRKMMKRHPYTTWKMVERLARPVWVITSLIVWFKTLYTMPLIAYAYVAWMVCGWGGLIWSYSSFLRKYPYCAKHVWAFIIHEYIGFVVDIYVYLTMKNDNWLTRVADIQNIKA